MDDEEVQMDSFWGEIMNQHPGEMNLEAVTSALQQGAPVDGDEGALLTPLQHAAHTSNLRLARILCDFNASLELPTRLHEGCTAMHLATRAGNEAMVLLLVAMGARVDAKDDRGRTPLHFAAEAGHNDIVDLLLSYGAPVDVKDAAGHTPVLYAAREGHTHTLKTLIDHGCSLHTLDQDGATPLHLAAERGHLRTVCMLLVSGVSPDIEDNNRCKAEDRALRRGWTVVVDLLQHPQDAGDILEQFALEERAGGGDEDDNLLDSLDVRSEVRGYLKPDDRTASGMEPELSAFDDNTRVEPSSASFVDIDVDPEASGLAEAINKIRLVPLAALDDNGPESLAPPAFDNNNDSRMSFLPTADVKRVAESCIEQEYSYPAGGDDKSPDLLRFDDRDDGTCKESSASSAVGDSLEAGSSISTCGAGNIEQRSLPIARGDSMEAQTLCFSSGDDGMEPEPSCLSSGDDGLEQEPSCLSSGDDGLEQEPLCLSSGDDGLEPEPSCLSSGDDGLEQEHNDGCSVNTEPNRSSAFGGGCVVEQQSPANTYDSCTTGDPPGRGSGDPGLNLDNIRPSKQDLNKKLLAAAAEGLVREMELMVERGADLSSTSTNPGEEGLQALHLACWGGHTEVVAKLLDYGVDPRAVAAGREGVHWAAFGGHVTVLRLLKERGCDVTAASTPDGSTPLHLAADNGNLDAIRWLVQHGVKIHAVDGMGRTALELAQASRAKLVVDYLERKSDEELLLRAAACGLTNSAKTLIEKGVNVNAGSYLESQEGWRALHLAADGGHKGVVEVLLQAGVLLDVTNAQGMTAAHIAAQAGHLEILQLLIGKLPPIEAENNGRHLVHWAAIGGYVPVLNYLQTKKYNLKVTTGKEETALHLAADHGNLEAVQWLVKQGINFNLRDNKGFTAEDFARKEHHREVYSFLRNLAKVQEAKLLEAASEGHMRGVSRLLDCGVNVDCACQDADNRGRRPIHFAAHKGNLDVLQALLLAGAKREVTDIKGNTAMHWAALGGQLKTMQFLRANNCKVAVLNCCRETPLHFAASANHPEVLKWLLAQGVDRNIKSSSGITAEDIASRRRHHEAAEVLHNFGKNIDAITA
ncbi:serine/threonine-protein phosphatase 6 regulatory ankyrin repeat subunit B [Procambarus clarkii]|uniref:serine/threonine-protein phosphatase 6 regulatory ankyrin repeat subunit B n=1 Tax=Procambarus clarkii TaxID=6728 RepID=UPI001E670103|nr:ankyrin-3-like [Procambarus clarkii]